MGGILVTILFIAIFVAAIFFGDNRGPGGPRPPHHGPMEGPRPGPDHRPMGGGPRPGGMNRGGPSGGPRPSGGPGGGRPSGSRPSGGSSGGPRRWWFKRKWRRRP